MPWLVIWDVMAVWNHFGTFETFSQPATNTEQAGDGSRLQLPPRLGRIKSRVVTAGANHPQTSRMLVFLLTPNVDIGGEGKYLDHPQAPTPVQRAIVSRIRLGIRKHLFQKVIQFIERRKLLAPTGTRAEQPQ